MENMTTLRVDLGISAQKIIQQLMISNEHIETILQENIKRAFDDLTKESTFAELVYEGTKREIQKIMVDSVCDWKVRSKIQEAIEKAIDGKLNDYAQGIADKFVASLKK